MWQASHRIRGVPPDKVEESRLLAPQRVPDGQNACVAGVFWYSARPFDWPPYYRDESAATYLIGYGAIAQLGERLHGMQEVDGSIPSGSTNKINNLETDILNGLRAREWQAPTRP